MGRKKNVDPSQVPLMNSELVVAAFEILMDAYIKSLGRCSSGQKVTITIKSYFIWYRIKLIWFVTWIC